MYSAHLPSQPSTNPHYMLCHLNIGSNTGNSPEIIRRAITLIQSSIALPGSLHASTPIQSDPWGYISENKYTNVGVDLLTEMSPMQLLHQTQQIEQQLGATPHRNPDGSYRDRNIDIDIIHLGDIVINTPGLSVPHPQMHRRSFVLKPIAELSPDWIHPILKKTAAQLLNDL